MAAVRNRDSSIRGFAVIEFVIPRTVLLPWRGVRTV